MRVYRAGHNDVDGAGEMWLALTNETAPELKPNLDWWLDQTHRLIDMANYYLWIAEVDGKMAGFVDGIMMNDPSTGEMVQYGRHMYVKPLYRNTGVMGALHRQGIRTGKEWGARIFKNTVRSQELPMFLKCGYQPVETVLMRMR